MFLSAETECSSGALRFGAGEKKLVTAGCLRSPWVHGFTVIHAYAYIANGARLRMRPVREATLSIG